MQGVKSNKQSQETQPSVMFTGSGVPNFGRNLQVATTRSREMLNSREEENASMDAKIREMDEDSESSHRPFDMNLSDSQSALLQAHSFTIGGGGTWGVSLCGGPMKATIPKKRSVEDSFPPPPAHVNGMDDHTEMSTMHGSWLDEVCPYAPAVDADDIIALTKEELGSSFLAPLSVCRKPSLTLRACLTRWSQ